MLSGSLGRRRGGERVSAVLSRQLTQLCNLRQKPLQCCSHHRGMDTHRIKPSSSTEIERNQLLYITSFIPLFLKPHSSKLCFSFNVKKATCCCYFSSVLDYGDLLYMHSSAQCLLKIYTVYHASLRFITNWKALTHHSELYSRVLWPASTTRIGTVTRTPLYLGRVPLCALIKHKSVRQYSLRSQDRVLLDIPNACTEIGKRAFLYAAPSI